MSNYTASYWSSSVYPLGTIVAQWSNGVTVVSLSSLSVGRCSLLVSCCKGSQHRCFSRPGAQGSVIAAFNPLAAPKHVTQTRVLFLSLSGGDGGDSNVYIKDLPSVWERMGRLVC